MNWIIVLEKRLELRLEIEEALSQVDPSINVIPFSSSNELMSWLNGISKRDVAAMARVPSGQFRGIVTEVESWNFKDVRLIEKFRPLFYQMGFAPKDQELCVVLTGYDTPQLHKKRFERRSINNFIFKPFDKLLLRQMLEIALTGRHGGAKHHIHNLKVDLQVEMLKEIRLSGVSEIGFQTVSDQPVSTGHLAKYYAPFLETKQHKSALAAAVSSVPIPQTQLHRITLGFFALDQQQSFNLQKIIQPRKVNQPIAGTQGERGLYEFLFLQNEKTVLCQEVQPSLDRFFDHSMTPVKSLVDLGHIFKKAEEAKAKTHLIVFVDSFFILGNEVAELENLQKLKGNLTVSVYVLSPRIFAESLELSLSSLCTDVFYSPFNRSYIIKTLKRKWPDLRTKEGLFESFGDLDQMIYVSNPVKLVEVSEATLVMEYYREISIGSFREFILWMTDEASVPILLGQCNFAEYVPEKKCYHCHFIFFSLQDLQQKHIRRWMLHNYIETKSEQ